MAYAKESPSHFATSCQIGIPSHKKHALGAFELASTTIKEHPMFLRLYTLACRPFPM